MAEHPTVLVIMDDLQDRCKLREHLMAQGFRVFATDSTPKALGWLERHTVNAIVADCLLPGTRVAIPHMLKRRWRAPAPTTFGVVRYPLAKSERLRELLGYDELFTSGTPAVLVTKRLLQRSI